MLSEADIRDLGVRNGAHRARLVSSLVMLRDAQQRHGKTRRRLSSVQGRVARSETWGGRLKDWSNRRYSRGRADWGGGGLPQQRCAPSPEND